VQYGIKNHLRQQHLPEEVRKIESQCICASQHDVETASLVVAFSGFDNKMLQELRENGISAPAVNLCQFADNLAKVSHSPLSVRLSVQEVLISAALQFACNGGSSTCVECEAQLSEIGDYWVNLADSCARFAHAVHKLLSVTI
jgi:hypothetical protein